MKSFPSTLNKGGNAFSKTYGASMPVTSYISGFDTDLLKYDIAQEKQVLLNTALPSSITSPNNEGTTTVGISSSMIAQPDKLYGQIKYENPNKMPASVYDAMNRYKYFYMVASQIDNNTFIKYDNSNDKVLQQVVLSQGTAPSLFSPFNSVNILGFDDNTPLLDTLTTARFVVEDMEVDPSKNTYEWALYNVTNKTGESNARVITRDVTFDSSKFDPDISNCTIKELVNLSKSEHSILGHAKYRYADFMYCSDLGKIPNNHLITLRKFATPIGDNIFKGSTLKGTMIQTRGDIGRLVTWFGNGDNKLEDIMHYSFNASFKPLNAEIEEQDSKAESNQGMLASFANGDILNKGYLDAFSKGLTNGQNNPYDPIGRYLWSKIGIFGEYQSGQQLGFMDDQARRLYYGSTKVDRNQIYTPRNTVQDTHIYEGKLTSTHEFTLTFRYKLRSYANINPKSAFLDLICNILTVTYRQGKFWGGDRKIIGPPNNNSQYRKVNGYIDKFWDVAGDAIKNLANGSISFGSLITSVWSQAKQWASDIFNGAKKQLTSTSNKGLFESIISNPEVTKWGVAAKAMLKNQIGRPAVYAWQSLLSGDDVGLWHVTIGNPKNPIAAFGNLIMTDASIQHSGPLGVDDFPTEIVVTCKLKQGRSRDATELQRYYTRGQSALYITRRNTKIAKTFQYNKSDAELADMIEEGTHPMDGYTVENDLRANVDPEITGKIIPRFTEQDVAKNVTAVADKIDFTAHGDYLNVEDTKASLGASSPEAARPSLSS